MSLGVSDQSSVQGVHARGGYVLEPYNTSTSNRYSFTVVSIFVCYRLSRLNKCTGQLWLYLCNKVF